SMSITAFPVLARILTERNLLSDPVGNIALACAAVDDISAWSILAGIVLIVRATTSASSLWHTIVGSLIYIVVMVFGARRLLLKIECAYLESGRVSQDLLTIILLCLLVSSWVTEFLGINALFGAFMMGVIMPKNKRFV